LVIYIIVSGMDGQKTSHLPIRYFLALLWAHPILHISTVRVNNCPKRCNTKLSIYYSASSLYMFRVSTTPIIRSTQNCKYSLRCLSYSFPPTWRSLATLERDSWTKNMTSTGGCSYSFVYSWWWVWLTPETCRVNLHNNK